jgi:hypothetical protein
MDYSIKPSIFLKSDSSIMTLPCIELEIDLRRFERTTESHGIRICARWHAIGIARPKAAIAGIVIAFVARMMIERINFH